MSLIKAATVLLFEIEEARMSEMIPGMLSEMVEAFSETIFAVSRNHRDVVIRKPLQRRNVR